MKKIVCYDSLVQVPFCEDKMCNYSEFLFSEVTFYRIHTLTTSMEEVISRFTHIAVKIFEELDNHHFIQCKVISPSWKNFIEENKFSYIRIITTSTKCSKKAVKKTFPKANLEETMRLASDVTKVYNELLKVKVYDPSLKIFHMAAKCGSLSVSRLIMNSIEDKHPKSCKKQTPLHYAAENGNFDICQLIVGINANKGKLNNSRDLEGNTPVHMAAKNGHLSVCELLIGLKENADNAFSANIQNSTGITPLHLAARNGHLSVCQFLVGKVENLNVESIFGGTPLGFAIMNGHSAICHLLIESNVDVNISYMRGRTPLHLAAENNLLSVFKKLMEIADEGQPQDDDGNTPLHLAAWRGHQEICELFGVSKKLLNNIHKMFA